MELKKSAIKSAIAIALAFLITGKASYGADPVPLQATAVYGVISTDPVYLWMAQEKGLFKKHGLNIDMTHIPTNQAVQALVGGKVQFTTAGPQVVEAVLAGGDPVYILGVINSFVLSVYGKPEINGINGLAGKTIGATNKGTPTDIAARLILKQHGLAPDADVKFAYLKELPALVAALKEGIIDAAAITPPNTLTARNLGLKELLNITALKMPFVQHSVATTRSYINTNPESVRRFVRSALEGLDYTRKNRADVISVMSKYTKINDSAQLHEAVDAYEKAWEKIPVSSQAAIQAVLAASPNPKAKGAKWDQFVDDRFVKEIVAGGALK